MISRQLDRFLAPEHRAGDVDLRRRARVIAGTILVVAFHLLILAGAAVLAGLWANAAGLALAFATAVLLAILFRRGMRLEIVAALVGLAVFAAAAQGAVELGGIAAPPLRWLSAVMLLVFFSAGAKAGRGFAVLGLVTYGAFFLLQPRFAHVAVAPYVHLADAVALTGAMYGLASVYETSKQHAIDEMRAAKERVEELQAELVEQAHRAGMADVAASVLHNAGNSMNHVTTAAGLLTERITKLKVDTLGDLSAKIAADANDPRARLVAEYVAELGVSLKRGREEALGDLASLKEGIAQVAAVLQSQQAFLGERHATSVIDLAAAVEEVVRLERVTLAPGVTIETDLERVAPFVSSRHRILLVFVNLMRNAVTAVGASGKIVVRLRADGERLRLDVTDDGVGIAPERAKKIFSPRYTTKAESRAHGYGLHSSALAAEELGGTLRFHSDGAGKGTTFTLELPRKTA